MNRQPRDWRGRADADVGIDSRAVDPIDTAEHDRIAVIHPRIRTDSSGVLRIENWASKNACAGSKQGSLLGVPAFAQSPRLGANKRVALAIEASGACRVPEECILAARQVANAGRRSEEGVAEARRVAKACIGAEEGVEIAARRVRCACSGSDKSIEDSTIARANSCK